MTPYLRWTELGFFLAVLGFAAVMTLFGYFLQQFAEALVPPGREPMVTYAILVLVCGGLLYLFFRASRNRIFSIFSIFGSSVEINRDPAPRPFVITGISPLNIDLAAIHAEVKHVGSAAVASNAVGYERAYEDAEGNAKPLRHNWQQNIRALWFHRSVLREVFVLDNGQGRFDDFKGYVLAVLQESCPELKITMISDPVDPRKPFSVWEAGVKLPSDYENYRYCDEGLRRGLAMIEERLLSSDIDEHCCIDVTPGIKIFSIAAGAVTFNRELIFSYANNDGNLSFYNASGAFTLLAATIATYVAGAAWDDRNKVREILEGMPPQ
ncbi:MAG: hypothetical protein WC048_02390 [Rhizobium sp.]